MHSLSIEDYWEGATELGLKRQALTGALLAIDEKQSAINHELSASRLKREQFRHEVDKFSPVSYTHLDVYKRQLLRFPFGWHVLLRPFLAALRARGSRVIPVIDSPLVPEVLYFHVLIPFPHENPPRFHVRRGTSKVETLQAACHHELCPPWARRNARKPPQRQRT